MPNRDDAIAAVKAAFNINVEARRIALNDAIEACNAAYTGPGFSEYEAGFESGVNECIQAIKALMAD